MTLALEMDKKWREGKAEGKIEAIRNPIKDGLTTLAAVKKSGRYTEEEIAAIAAAKGGKLIVSKEERNIQGGFVLIYGGIEENCTFKAMFDSRRGELSDKVHALLFS